MDLTHGLQYLGVITGLSGALLVSQRSAARRRGGFLVWVVSNSCLIGWAWTTGTRALLGMYAFFSVTSFMGWWNNQQRGKAPLAEPASE
jgi:hypothetical protein